MKKQKEELINEQEFDVWELENLGELILEKIRTLFVRLDHNLDDTYTIDYYLKLFEKIQQRYLKGLQEVHKQRNEWERERLIQELKFEKQLNNKKTKRK